MLARKSTKTVKIGDSKMANRKAWVARNGGRIPDNAIIDKIVDGKPHRMDIKTVDDAVTFIRKFNMLDFGPRGGYDKFWNNDGPSNPVSPKKSLSARGLTCNILAFVDALYSNMATATDKSDYETALNVINGYLLIAKKVVADRLRVDQLLGMIASGVEADAEYAKSQLQTMGIDPANMISKPEVITTPVVIETPVVETVETAIETPVVETVETAIETPVVETVETAIETTVIQTEPVIVQAETEQPKKGKKHKATVTV
jgi:hypothetical protein